MLSASKLTVHYLIPIERDSNTSENTTENRKYTKKDFAYFMKNMKLCGFKQFPNQISTKKSLQNFGFASKCAMNC